MQKPQTEIAPASLTSSATIAIARRNSLIAGRSAFVASALSLLAIGISVFIDGNYGKIAAVPVGNVWDLPIVGRMYLPSRIEENAKPMHVALRYIRNFYEVDLTDFVRLGSLVSETGVPTMVSTSATQLLPYVLPGTAEYTNVLQNIEYSSVNYRLFTESNCWRRFLADSVEMSDSLSGTKRIDVIGTFIIACDDTAKPMPSQNLGLKLITIYVAKGAPTMFAGEAHNGPDKKQDGESNVSAAVKLESDKDQALSGGALAQGAAIAALNPEGWFVIKNIITSLSKDEQNVLKTSRSKQGIKAVK